LTLAKFYSNNLLLIFNSRVRIVGGREGVTVQAEVTNVYPLKTINVNVSTTVTTQLDSGADSLPVGEQNIVLICCTKFE